VLQLPAPKDASTPHEVPSIVPSTLDESDFVTMNYCFKTCWIFQSLERRKNWVA